MFKELAVLVIDQGTMLDRIDYNIEQVVHQSKEANVQLAKVGVASEQGGQHAVGDGRTRKERKRHVQYERKLVRS